MGFASEVLDDVRLVEGVDEMFTQLRSVAANGQVDRVQ